MIEEIKKDIEMYKDTLASEKEKQAQLNKSGAICYDNIQRIQGVIGYLEDKEKKHYENEKKKIGPGKEPKK